MFGAYQGYPAPYKASNASNACLPHSNPAKLCLLPNPMNSRPSLPMPSGAGFPAFPALRNQTSQGSAASTFVLPTHSFFLSHVTEYLVAYVGWRRWLSPC